MTAARLLLFGLVVGGILGPFCLAQPPAVARPGPQTPPELRPRWEIGLRWEVETTSLQSNAAVPVQGPPGAEAVAWQFTVQKVERLAGRDCYRVAVKSKLAPDQPGVNFWVDRQTFVLRQVEVEITVQGVVRSVMESYDVAGGQPAPVLGPIPSLPVDLPAFGVERGRNSRFEYATISGPAGPRPRPALMLEVEIDQHSGKESPFTGRPGRRAGSAKPSDSSGRRD